jgi:hypothetical protein
MAAIFTSRLILSACGRRIALNGQSQSPGSTKQSSFGTEPATSDIPNPRQKTPIFAATSVILRPSAQLESDTARRQILNLFCQLMHCL